MKRIISFLIFFNCISIFAQREIQPEFAALIYTSRQEFYTGKTTWENPNDKLVSCFDIFYGFKLKFGPRFLSTNKSVSVNLQYQFLQHNNNLDDALLTRINGKGLRHVYNYYISDHSNQIASY